MIRLTLLSLVVACGTTPSSTSPPVARRASGGQIFVQSITFDRDLQEAFGLPVASAADVLGFFLDDEGMRGVPAEHECTNLTASPSWPDIGLPFVELDVGTLTLTGPNGSGAITTIDVAQRPAGIDSYGRAHDIYYYYAQPNASDVLHPDRVYAATTGGTATMPATTFTDAILLPAAFTVTAPALDDDGPLVAGTDFTVTWTPATTTNAGTSDHIAAAVWLTDGSGSPTHVCMGDHAAGSLTIPGSTIAEYKAIAQARGMASDKALLLVDALASRAQQLPAGDPQDPRDIDFVGIVRTAQVMDVQ